MSLGRKFRFSLGFLTIFLLSAAQGSCWRYGHSCWGGHGKRSGGDTDVYNYNYRVHPRRDPTPLQQGHRDSEPDADGRDESEYGGEEDSLEDLRSRPDTFTSQVHSASSASSQNGGAEVSAGAQEFLVLEAEPPSADKEAAGDDEDEDDDGYSLSSRKERKRSREKLLLYRLLT